MLIFFPAKIYFIQGNTRFTHYDLLVIPYVFSFPSPPYCYKTQKIVEQQQASLMSLVLPLSFRFKPWFCWSPAQRLDPDSIVVFHLLASTSEVVRAGPWRSGDGE